MVGQVRLELDLGRSRPAPVEELDRQLGIALGAEALAQLAGLGEDVVVAGAAAAADRLGVLAQRLVEAAQPGSSPSAS